MKNILINLSSPVIIEEFKYTLLDIAQKIKNTYNFNGRIILKSPLKNNLLRDTPKMSKEEILIHLHKIQIVEFIKYENESNGYNFTHYCDNIKQYEGIPIKALIEKSVNTNNIYINWKDYNIDIQTAILLADSMRSNEELEIALLGGLKVTGVTKDFKIELKNHIYPSNKYGCNQMNIPYNLWIGNKTINDKYLVDFNEITLKRLKNSKYCFSPCEIIVDNNIYQKGTFKKIPFDFELLNEMIEKGFILNQEIIIDVINKNMVNAFAKLRKQPKFKYKFSVNNINIDDLSLMKVNLHVPDEREYIKRVLLPYIHLGINITKPTSDSLKYMHSYYNFYIRLKKGMELKI